MKKLVNLIKNGTSYQIGAVSSEEVSQIKTDIQTVSGIATSNSTSIQGLRGDVDTISGKVETLEAHNIFKVVTELPEVGETNVVYLLPDTEGQDDNVYIEYIYVDGKYEQIGKYKANVDLTGYAKENWVNLQIANDDKTWYGTMEQYNSVAKKIAEVNYFIYIEEA